MSAKEIKVLALPIDIQEDATYSIEQPNPNSYTHGFFKYPCKFIPEIPRWAIAKYAAAEANSCIYDPFSGSGTTLLEASLRGMQSYGSEIDATAQLITRAKTTPLTNEQLEQLEAIFDSLIGAINNDGAPTTIAPITNIEHWFPVATITHLGRLRYAIEHITDNVIRDFFSTCFAAIIKKVSYADDVSPKPYVSTKIKKSPQSVEREFRSTYTRYKEAISQLSAVVPLGGVTLLEGGASNLNLVSAVDLAITSPPYINAFDYARSMRLENLWLGYATEQEIRESKQHYVGTESIEDYKKFSTVNHQVSSELLSHYIEQIIATDQKRAAIVNRFFEDMQTNLQLVYRALKPKSKYVIVIGNSNIRNVNIESWKVLKEIALSLGYTYETHFSYKIKNPYIRIPREGQGGNINIDHILVISK